MDFLSKDGLRLEALHGCELTTIEDYAVADNFFREHITEFWESMPKYDRPPSPLGVDLKSFEDSKYFTSYVDALKKDLPRSWMKFKGYTNDKVTCMKERFLDTLHAKMKYGEVLMELLD